MTYVNNRQKKELVKKEKEVLELWDSKIAEHQYLLNTKYHNSEWMKGFFDKLDNCYDKLRRLLNQEDLSNEDKNQVIDFIMSDFPKNVGIKKRDVLEKLQVKNIDQVFIGANLEIVKRLENLLNPRFISSHAYIQDFDIWEKRENLNLKAGDTTFLMIRLLRNYDLNSHQMELIESDDLKVIEPYLGELRVIVSKDAKRGDEKEISYELYDWIIQDTIVQNIRLLVN